MCSADTTSEQFLHMDVFKLNLIFLKVNWVKEIYWFPQMTLFLKETNITPYFLLLSSILGRS